MTRKEFINACKAKKPPKKSKLLSVAITEEERSLLKKGAIEQGLTMSDYVKSRLFYD